MRKDQVSPGGVARGVTRGATLGFSRSGCQISAKPYLDLTPCRSRAIPPARFCLSLRMLSFLYQERPHGYFPCWYSFVRRRQVQAAVESRIVRWGRLPAPDCAIACVAKLCTRRYVEDDGRELPVPFLPILHCHLDSLSCTLLFAGLCRH